MAERARYDHAEDFAGRGLSEWEIRFKRGGALFSMSFLILARDDDDCRRSAGLHAYLLCQLHGLR